MDAEAMFAKSTFKIKPDQLIEICEGVIDRKIGVGSPDDLADDFVFQFPVVGPLTKGEYIAAVSNFNLGEMFPDYQAGIYDMRVDPLMPNRVWYTAAFRGTNLGSSPLNKEPTGKLVICPPQAASLTFNEEGKVIMYTGGYVMDRTIGNSGGVGGMFGLMVGIGKPLPFPEAQPYSRSWQFSTLILINRLTQFVTKLLKSLGLVAGKSD
jgi:hypothetical protein